MSSESGTFPAVSGECVHTIWSYTDGPREGIADFHGKPYIYKCQFSEAHDDWTDLFWLMEIDQPLLGLATKKNEIFLRWNAEFKLGNVSINTHPALPADRAHYDKLEAEIGDRLQLQPELSIIRRGHFLKRSVPDDTVVNWTTV
jgi:hypothetical protein